MYVIRATHRQSGIRSWFTDHPLEGIPVNLIHAHRAPCKATDEHAARLTPDEQRAREFADYPHGVRADLAFLYPAYQWDVRLSDALLCSLRGDRWLRPWRT